VNCAARATGDAVAGPAREVGLAEPLGERPDLGAVALVPGCGGGDEEQEQGREDDGRGEAHVPNATRATRAPRRSPLPRARPTLDG
jgi:hypothetical protein